MSFEKELEERSGSKCELCASTENLTSYEVSPSHRRGADDYVMVCNTCLEQLNDASKTEPNHWRCLNDSMWSEIPAVQVVAWRMLSRLKNEGWSQDLLDQLYLDDEILDWAKMAVSGTEESVKHIDSNGNILQNGDNVVLIKDLNVKGGGFTAKRGAAVRGIRLDPDNAGYIEGKVDGQLIVILTQYVKKTN